METNNDDQTTDPEIEFPHKGFGLYFDISSKSHDKNTMFYAKCKMCVGHNDLSVAHDFANNLRKHIKVCVNLCLCTVSI